MLHVSQVRTRRLYLKHSIAYLPSFSQLVYHLIIKLDYGLETRLTSSKQSIVHYSKLFKCDHQQGYPYLRSHHSY